eukprot:symbB.v1.2.027121.t1/scaffold2756.1/size127779/14
MRVPNVGPLHSGIADARNVARILLALWQQGVVCKLNQRLQVKQRPFFRPKETASESTSIPEVPPESEKINTFREAMVLLLANVEDASDTMTGLHFTKGDQRFISGHVRCLGHSPLADDPGAQRQFLVSCGEDRF